MAFPDTCFVQVATRIIRSVLVQLARLHTVRTSTVGAAARSAAAGTAARSRATEAGTGGQGRLLAARAGRLASHDARSDVLQC